MGIGVISISTNRKVDPSGPPFVPTSANNGLSVSGGGAIVLGNNVGGVSAQLLSIREIPTAGFAIRLTGSGNFTVAANIGVGVAAPSAKVHAFSSVNAASEIKIENGTDGTQSTAQFRAMIGGASITDFGTAGGAFNINPHLPASGFINTNATNGFVISMNGAAASFRVVTSAVGEALRLTNAGSLGIGLVAPTAFLNIKPGTAAAGTAPIKLSSGVNLTAPEAGAIEWNGANIFFTNVATRENFIVGNDGAAAPGTTIGVAIVNFYGTAATNYLGDPNSWAGVVINGVAYKIPLYT